MKKTVLIMLMVAAATFASAQEEESKTGWNLGPLPTITFDTDLGFQYGALLNLFNYGDGKIYPNYYQMLYFEVSRFTKGSGIYRFMFDSEYLIPGIQLTTDLSYLTDDAYEFYGFNGYDAIANMDWFDSESGDYVTRMFYRHKRGMFRFKNDIQGKISGDNLRWNVGITALNFKLESVDIDKLNKGQDPEDQLPEVDGLYEKYQDWGLISPEEADGGWVNSIKVGITWDSRDNKPNPMKGMWTEAGIEVAPSFLGTESSFSKFYAVHRQYFTLIEKDLGFAYRLGYQTTIGGDVPFYYQSQLITSILRGASSEGLGGGKSLRGIMRNRVIGDGIFYGNAELRWKAVRFDFINQKFYIGVNAFSDFGMVTDKIDFTVPTQVTMGTDMVGDYFAPDSEEMHFSAGLGLRIVMNQNFIIAADLGKALDARDGGMGFYMGLNYLF